MGKKGGGNNEAAQARADEQARQERIRQGTDRVDQIFANNFGTPYYGTASVTPNEGFFGGRKQAYLDYATPQLEDQYGKAQRDLTFALARGNNLESSVRGQKFAELQKLYDQRRREVGDQSVAQETEARNNIEGARSDLIRTLSATGDAEGAANNAISRSQALSAPAAFSPLGQLFADFTSTLGSQMALERAEALSGGVISRRGNSGLFGVSPNSVRVT